MKRAIIITNPICEDCGRTFSTVKRSNGHYFCDTCEYKHNRRIIDHWHKLNLQYERQMKKGEKKW